MSFWLQRQWYRLSLWHLLLIPLSWLFWLLSGLRRLGYKIGLLPSYKLSVPVIVVGNISVGGTGKTPVVIWLAERLKQAGYRPGIISRGYGGSSKLVSAVHADSDPGLMGDEPVLLARRELCPVWVGHNRVAAGSALLKMHPECNVIISDDGLQHYRLRRDVEVIVLDGQRRFGNRCLLPAGPLRETVARLKTADAIVNNGGKAIANEFSMRLESAIFHNLLNPLKIAAPPDFSGRGIHAIAAIGNPAKFFQQLHEMGMQFEQSAFADHYAFKPADLQSITAEAILMTEKDAVKCVAFAQPHWWYLPVEAVLDEALTARIFNKLKQTN